MTRSRTPQRILAGIALTVGAWLAAPTPSATAAPSQTMVEYGASVEAAAKATDKGQNGNAKDSAGDTLGNIVDQAKNNMPLVIVGGGVLLVTGLWKTVSR